VYKLIQKRYAVPNKDVFGSHRLCLT